MNFITSVGARYFNLKALVGCVFCRDSWGDVFWQISLMYNHFRVEQWPING